MRLIQQSFHPQVKFAFLILIFLAGCGPARPTLILPGPTQTQARLTATSVPIPATRTPAPTATSTAAPSPTPRPQLINARNYTDLQRIPEDTIQLSGLILALNSSNDGKFLAVSTGEDILVLDQVTLEVLQTLNVGALTKTLKFFPEKSGLLASGSNDGFVRIWDWESGDVTMELYAHPKGVNQIAFQPGGQLLVSAGNDALVQLWDLESGDNLGYLIGGAFAVPDLAFLAGGDRLLTVDGGVIRMREVATGRLVTSLRVGESVPVIVPDPGGAWVAASIKPAIVQIWGLTEPELLGELRLDELRDVWSMVLSPGGDVIAAGGRDGSICFFPVNSLAESACQRLSERPISALAFMPDGRRMISGGYDGELNIWQVSP